ncbi:MAG TPA: acyl carrier protein [Anaeromyxobacteraceae bacterium]|nr:acyl carrier protein [Anaeromyxobacteraceae bacterium]
MTVQERVRQFIVENFYVAEPSELHDAASLIQGGWVDSTGMLELIAFLEESYGLRIADAEMTPENLDSIDAIAAFVARKGVQLSATA